jgi:[acyl-carrier-protein] S-malonyltransferase
MAKAASLQDGSMVALMGPDEGAIDKLGSLHEAWVANVNGDAQIVVSGTRAGLDALLENYKDLGWKRATPLPVGGAFHSPLMAPAQEELDGALAETTWGTTDAILIANVDGAAHTSASDWQGLLSRQLTSPVEFLKATNALPASITTSIEMPPGNVLSGLTKRIRNFDRQIAIATVETLKENPL